MIRGGDRCEPTVKIDGHACKETSPESCLIIIRSALEWLHLWRRRNSRMTVSVWMTLLGKFRDLQFVVMVVFEELY